MAVNSMLNLPYFIEAMKGSVNRAKLVGVVVGEVIPPSSINEMGLLTKSDAFVAVDLVGFQSETDSFYVAGRILSVIPRYTLEEAKRKKSGRLAVELSGAPIRISRTEEKENFLVMARWAKGNLNNWKLRSCVVRACFKTEYPEFFETIVRAYKNNWRFIYPVEIPSGYEPVNMGYEFVFVDDIKAGETAPVSWSQDNTEPSIPAERLVGTPSELGKSNQSNISDLSRNLTISNREAKFKSKSSRIKTRYKIEPLSEEAELFNNAVEEAEKGVKAILETLRNFDESVEEDLIDERLEYTARMLKANWDRRAGDFTGRALFKEAVEKTLPDLASKMSGRVDTLTEHLEAMGRGIVDEWLEISGENMENTFLKSIHDSKLDIYVAMIDVLLGLWGRLSEAYQSSKEESTPFFEVLENNPYYLCFLDPRITIEDLDKLAMMKGIDLQDEDVHRVRNIAYMHNCMLDPNGFMNYNTIIKEKELYRHVRSGYVLSKRTYNILKAQGLIIQQIKLESLKTFIDPKVNIQNFSLPLNGWRETRSKAYLETGGRPGDVIKDYINSGLGVKVTINGENWIADYILAYKEMYIYNRLRDLCEYNPIKKNSEDVEMIVTAFESLKRQETGIPNYKLEAMQSEAVRVIGEGYRVVCLTGPAGSGKTTTAEAQVFSLETLYYLNEDGVFFGTPTGKAASRMKEVVKRNARTINSLFRIGGESVALKDPEKVTVREDIKAVILDECSMMTTPLLYELLLRVADGTYMIFLGDVKQLPPIGFGKPYANMLTFLPTVVLNVSKRASDKSLITRNAQKIIYESDGVIEDLEEGPEYRIINDTDISRVVTTALNVVEYHLGKGSAQGFSPAYYADDKGKVLVGPNMNPDDIQVITPINKHAWGTVNLNKRLQDIFNPRKGHSPVVRWSRGVEDIIEYRIGDRVIHTLANQNNRKRLLDHGNGVFSTLKNENNEPVTGIANGDVGKVVGIYPADKISFEAEDNQEVQKILQEQYGGGQNTVYIAVAYPDVDIVTSETVSFIILYRAELLRLDADLTYEVISSDLRYLDLAYALTVHKLQGSQSKLCVVLFLPVGGPNSDFISRNMIYTATTRAEGANYLIGDILGKNSTVNRGRKIDQVEKRQTLLDLV